MLKNKLQKVFSLFFLLATFNMLNIAYAATAQSTTDPNLSNAIVTQQILQKAQANNNWKFAFVTGKHEQVVFMNVSPMTNPKNEIGIETHPFDQVILIVEGNGKAILNGQQASMVSTGDMIFIPQGVQHNVINLNTDKPLKLISFYSATDIPPHAVYKTKADQPQD